MASVDSLSILITASTGSAVTKVEALTKSLEGLASAINALDVSKFESLANAVTDLSNGFAGIKGGAAKDIGKIAKAVSNVAEQKDAFDPIKKGAEETATETKKVAENADKLSAATNKIDTTSIDGMAASMENVSQTLDSTTTKMSAFKSLLAKTKIIIPTEGLEKVDKRIEKLKERIADLQDKLEFKSRTQADYIDSKQMDKDKEKIAGLINELERLKLKKQELESHGGFKLNLSGAFSSLKSTLTDVNKKLSSFTSHMFKAKSAARETSKHTKSFDTAAKNLAKSLTKVTRMLKLMITRMALRTVIKETGNGFKSLALHCEEFDNSMSGIINSSKKLAYSFAGMVGPLVNALAPALLYIINLITRLINAFNQLFSALGGGGVWHKAKDFTGKWSDDIKSANKQAKELKKTVLGFDELNQLQDQNKSGGGDTSGNIEDMFEDAAIDVKIQNLAKKIKDIFKKLMDPIKKAWAKVGKEVVAAWSGAFKSIKKLLGDIGRDFLKVWDQPRTLQMLETILRIFKDIGGVVKYLADGLDKAWNTNKNGLRILEAIRDIFLTIVTHIRNMTYATMMWAKELNFTPLLEAFKDWVVSMKPVVDAISGAFEDFYIKVLLPLGKWSIEKGLPELIQVFTDFNNKVQWDQLREKLANLWDAIEPFAETIGEGLIQFIRDCSDALADFINSDQFENFLDAIADWMKEVKPEQVATALKVMVGAFLGLKALSFLPTITSAISMLSKVISGISALSGAIVPVIVIIGALALAIYSLTETYGGLNEAIGRVKQSFDTIRDSIDAVSERINLSGTFNELSQAFSELGVQLGDMKNAWEFAFGFIEGVGIWLAKTFMPTLNSTIRIIKDLVHVVSASLKYFEGFVTFIKGIFTLNGNEIKQGASQMWEGIKGVFTSALAAIRSIIHGLTGIIVEPFKQAKYDLVGDPIVIDMWNAIKKIFSESIANVAGFVVGLKDDIIGAFTSIKDNVIQTVTDLVSTVAKAFDKKNWTFSGVADGLRKTFQDAKDAIKGIWDSIADKLNGDHKIGFSSIRIDLPHFATGGFPKDDSMFMANSTEMVGKFSNGRNVVANNQQITDGIAQAVYSAMMSANAGGSTQYINNTIQIDGETIARAVTKGQKSIERRYSPTMA